MKEFFATLIAAKGARIAAFTMACLLALTGGGASGYYIYGATRPTVESVEIIEETVVEEEPIFAEIYEEEEEEPEALSNRIYLVSTSVEKDLKISIVNDVGVTVTGYPFEVYVSKYDEKKDTSFLAEVARQEALKGSASDEENDESDSVLELSGDKYVDDDKDGIIPIENISGGRYKVVLAPMDDFIVGGAIQVAEVKEKVEYKVVDVKNQIKKESQINAAIEDTSRKNVAEEGGMPDVSALLNTPSNDDKSDSKEKTYVKVSKDDISSDIKKVLAPTVAVADGKVVTLTKVTRVWNKKDETPAVPPASGEDTPPQQDDSDDAAAGNDIPDATGLDTPSVSVKKLILYKVGASRTEVKEETENGEVGEATYTYNDAAVSLPKNMVLFTNSSEKGNDSGTLSLSIDDSDGIINQSGISWTISNPKVASLSGSGKNAQITALRDGTATVKAVVPYNNGSETKTAEFSCAVEVKSVDLTQKLTDKNGEQLFLDKELKKEATLADYNGADSFYKEDKKEEAPSANVSVKSGSVGVDVSKWNGSINWSQVASSGVSFAIVRCGYRGSSTGALVQDPTFATNIKGAKKAGLKVGIYFFTQAVNEAEAVEEASMAVAMAKSYGINMPIYIDTEGAGGRADGLSKADRTACIKAFCKTVASAGYAPGVYASKCWYYDNLNAGELSGYNIWVAQYAAACNYSGRYNMWQYTSKGSVPGISGKVDMDIYY